MPRALPNNPSAEKSVLGACFLSKYALQKASDELLPESFYDDKNATIFSTMLRLLEEKTPLDLTTITTYLTNNNKLSSVGGVEYLTEVVNYVPSAANIDYYIDSVAEQAILRNLIITAEDIASSAYTSTEKVNDQLDLAEKKILDVVKAKKTGYFRTIKDIIKKTTEDLEKLSEKKTEITGLSTGITGLDKMTSGFHENEFIIIAARPAMGKTAFALNIATHVALHQEKSVIIFNMEMSAEQLATRILSSLGQIDGTRLRTGNLLNSDWKRINEAATQLSNSNLLIEDKPGITIGEIKSKCRRLAASDKGLALVVVDYIGLVSGGKNYGGNRQQEVADVSRSLKTMALELHVPVIALAQLSRLVESREEKRPIMSDLRESGSIEQDADIVSFLYRADYYDKTKARDDGNSESEYIIGKNRSGPTGSIDVLFKKNTSTFANLIKQEKGENNET